MTIAIVVYHREGQSVLRYLRRHPALYPKAEITVCDENPRIRVPRGVLKKAGPNYLKNLGAFDLIFRSPGLSYNRPEFAAARRAGAKFSSLTELFFEEAPKYLPREHIVGVSGSKGKSTVAALVFQFLKNAGRRAFFAGNIGVPALDILSKADKTSWAVLELSSFQLEHLGRSPHVAALTEIFPEHQDVHGGLRDYYRAKTELANHQRAGDAVFYLANNATTARIARAGRGRKFPVRATDAVPFAPRELKLKGAHQYANAVLAARVARYLGVPAAIIRKAARQFKGLPHRLEFVKKIGGIEFYDDSASTNPTAAAAAIAAFAGTPHVLIAGGVDKKLDYRPLARALAASGTRAVFVFGRDKAKIARALRRGRVPIRITSNLRSAVRLAHRALKKNPGRGAVVFSPAAVSFDMFENYAARGDAFKKTVQETWKRRG